MQSVSQFVFDALEVTGYDNEQSEYRNLELQGLTDSGQLIFGFMFLDQDGEWAPGNVYVWYDCAAQEWRGDF